MNIIQLINSNKKEDEAHDRPLLRHLVRTWIMSITGDARMEDDKLGNCKRGELKLPGRRSERCKDENKGQTTSEAIYEYH